MSNSRELSLLLTQIESGKKLLMEQILKLFLPNKILLKRTKPITNDVKIEVWQQYKVTIVTTLMPTIKTLKLTPYILDHLRDSAMINFHLPSKSFHMIFISRKKIVDLVL